VTVQCQIHGQDEQLQRSAISFNSFGCQFIYYPAPETLRLIASDRTTTPAVMWISEDEQRSVPIVIGFTEL